MFFHISQQIEFLEAEELRNRRSGRTARIIRRLPPDQSWILFVKGDRANFVNRIMGEFPGYYRYTQTCLLESKRGTTGYVAVAKDMDTASDLYQGRSEMVFFDHVLLYEDQLKRLKATAAYPSLEFKIETPLIVPTPIPMVGTWEFDATNNTAFVVTKNLVDTTLSKNFWVGNNSTLTFTKPETVSKVEVKEEKAIDPMGAIREMIEGEKKT